MGERRFKVITRQSGREHEETYTLQKLLAHILNELEWRQRECGDYPVDRYKVEEIESDE